MPEIHFVGEIENCLLESSSEALSLTFGIVPGGNAWVLQNGLNSGETHISSATADERGIFNYPIDAHYGATSVEGWPFFVCEVWERAVDDKSRLFKGCGVAYLPTTPGRHKLELSLWRPCEIGGLEGFYDMIMPEMPNLTHLREIVVSPFIRQKVSTETCGTVHININTVLFGFKQHGVIL